MMWCGFIIAKLRYEKGIKLLQLACGWQPHCFRLSDTWKRDSDSHWALMNYWNIKVAFRSCRIVSVCFCMVWSQLFHQVIFFSALCPPFVCPLFSLCYNYTLWSSDLIVSCLSSFETTKKYWNHPPFEKKWFCRFNVSVKPSGKESEVNTSRLSCWKF